jgi:hypothetical protein
MFVTIPDRNKQKKIVVFQTAARERYPSVFFGMPLTQFPHLIPKDRRCSRSKIMFVKLLFAEKIY